jgi:hypothetical protein
MGSDVVAPASGERHRLLRTTSTTGPRRSAGSSPRPESCIFYRIPARYLRDDAGSPAARARWKPVLAALGTQQPVAQALSGR